MIFERPSPEYDPYAAVYAKFASLVGEVEPLQRRDLETLDEKRDGLPIEPLLLQRGDKQVDAVDALLEQEGRVFELGI